MAWQNPTSNAAQLGYLHSFRRHNYFIAGRGAGKTAAACIKALIAGVMSPGVVGYITEQTTRDILDTLIPAWMLHVPRGTYELHNTQAGWEARLANGAVIRFRSRQAKNTIADPPFRGPTAGFLIHDEIALDTRSDVPKISEMMLRDERARVLFADYITTPKTNWFYAHMLSQGIAEIGKRIQITKDGAGAAYYGPTRDNAYNRDLDARTRDLLSESEAQQELEGWFVARDGLCWSSFVDEDWPRGNRLDDAGFRPGQPYILAVDHGGSDGAWLLLQARGAGRYCVVAEYTPSHKPAHEILPGLLARYGKPGRIITGADHVTPGASGHTAEWLFAQYGLDGVAERVTGDRAPKDVQGNRLAWALLNTAGERRLLVSRQLESHHPGPSRGVLDMLRHDAWPDAGYPHTFRKEKSRGVYHEDSRDALLYFAVTMWPPVWAEHTKWAAA